MAFQIKRGTDSQRLTYTAVSGELIYATDTKILYVGDGTTPGGVTVGTVSSAGDFTLNGLSGSVVLAAGTGLTLSVSGNTLTFANIGGACAGVNSVNGLSGAVVFASGSGMTLSISENTLTFATTGAPSGLSQYVESINGSTGVVTGAAFTTGAQSFSGLQTFLGGISANGITIFGKTSNYDAAEILFNNRIGPTFASSYQTTKLSISEESVLLGYNGPNLSTDNAGNTTSLTGVYIGINGFSSAYNNILSIVVGNCCYNNVFNNNNSGVQNNNTVLGNYCWQNLIQGNYYNNISIGNDIFKLVGITGNNASGLFGVNGNIFIGNKIGKPATTTIEKLFNNIMIGDDIFGLGAASNAEFVGTNSVIIGARALVAGACFASNSSILIGDGVMGKPALNGGITYDNIVMIGGRDRATDNVLNRNRDLPFGEPTQLLICSGVTSWIYGNSAGNVLLGEPRTVGRPAEKLHVAGNIYAGGTYVYIANQFTPGSSAANGTTGAFAWDNDYIYVCIGTNSWRRAGLTSW